MLNGKKSVSSVTKKIVGQQITLHQNESEYCEGINNFVSFSLQEDDNGSETHGAIDELEDVAAHILNINEDDQTNENITSAEIKICSTESHDNCEEFVAFTRDSAVSHALSPRLPEIHPYSNEKFYGLLIDTGCSRASSGGYQQYRALLSCWAACNYRQKQQGEMSTWNFNDYL